MNMSAIPPRRFEEAKRRRTEEKRASYTASTAPPQAPIQLPAQNVELEERVLSALLNDSQLLPIVRPTFTFPEDSRVRLMYREAHQQLLDRLFAYYDDGRIPEYYTILNEWITRENAGLDAKDERELLDRLMLISVGEKTPTEKEILQWAELLRGQALRRAANDFATTAAGIAYPSDIVTAATDPSEDIRKLAESITKLASSTSVRYDRFPIISDEEAQAMKPAQGILGDLLYEDSVAFLYGPSGRWKSFVALSWALAIATGQEWLGRTVEEGDVLYIAGEGARGLGKRITAWKRRHGITGKTRLHVLGMPIHLLDESQVQDLIAQVRKQFPELKLIVIDTLSRALIGGDENATSDANRAFDNASQIRAALGCCVLVVHHSGKDDTRGMRGSSVFPYNADTVIHIEGPKDRPLIMPGEAIKLVSEKPKENDPFPDIYLTTQVERWATDEGESISSLVIVASDAPEPKVKQTSGAKPFVPAAQQKMIDTLVQHPTGLRNGEWEKLAGIPHNTFSTNLRQLKEADRITCDGVYYILTDLGRSLSTIQYQVGTTVPSGTERYD